jgi:iron complex outermembrane recepter protein
MIHIPYKGILLGSLLLNGLLATTAKAQLTAQDTAFFESGKPLDSITITAFRNYSIQNQLPASVAILTGKALKGMGMLSLVPVFNQVAGVKMEERSPGSYRLTIRGSLLRSPFGVRNVKIYLNQVPLTDAGGNTYLNILPVGMLQQIEIIKGPAASVYGAGTGGVVLLQSAITQKQDSSHNRWAAAVTGGSFGTFKQSAEWQQNNKNDRLEIYQDHQQSNGYRQQTALRRDAITGRYTRYLGKQQLSIQALYANLFYQTPGGLTLSQFQQNPVAARPATSSLPGAVQQNSSVKNQTLWVSLAYQWDINSQWQLQTFVLNSETRFENPFITNYEKRSESNWGVGTHIRYSVKKNNQSLDWVTGMEWMQQRSHIDNYGNRNGKIDTLQFTDQLQAKQWYVYSQITYRLGKWVLDAGISSNQQPFTFQRVSSVGSKPATRVLPSLPAPRISITRKLANGNIYLLASRGFSPPTVAEIRPSDGNYYGELAPESGWNIEAGWRLAAANRRWNWEISLYRFSLQQTIVRRSNAAGAEYFINAGSTLQQGIETGFRWNLIPANTSRKWSLNWQSSFCYQPYQFVQYQQGSIDYSGHPITGVPPTILFTAAQFTHQKGWYATAQLTANAALPLNDLSDEYANPYQLFQAEAGIRLNHKKLRWQLFAGVDNILNQSYSLGNDINAAGRRYYNAAPGINAFWGIRLSSR